MLRKLAIASAKRFKGPDYEIDIGLSDLALLRYSLRRIAGLLRCIIRGVKFSVNPRNLVFIETGVELRNRNLITFGSAVTLGRGVIIDGLSSEGVNIGDRVSIGQYSIIEATGAISDIGKGFRIGNDSGLGAYSFVGAAGGVTIGEKVIMGQRISFHSENHSFDRIDIPIKEQGVTRKGIVIDDDCWVGANVTFLDGSHVGRGCIIAAGAVVLGQIPAYSIAAGVPAKVIKCRKVETTV